MPGGYTGRMLFVDLTSGKIDEERLLESPRSRTVPPGTHPSISIS